MLKLYTFGCVIDGPGNLTRDPVPKDIVGYGSGAVVRRRCASIERLLFDAHTVQNLSLNDVSGGGDVFGGDVS